MVCGHGLSVSFSLCHLNGQESFPLLELLGTLSALVWLSSALLLPTLMQNSPNRQVQLSTHDAATTTPPPFMIELRRRATSFSSPSSIIISSCTLPLSRFLRPCGNWTVVLAPLRIKMLIPPLLRHPSLLLLLLPSISLLKLIPTILSPVTANSSSQTPSLRPTITQPTTVN